MNHLLIPVILVVKNHWLLGKLRTAEQRVLDSLNDPQTDYLDLVEVKVFSALDRRRCLADLPAATIPKDGLYLLIIPTERYEPSRTTRIYRIEEKKAVSVCTVAAGYFVRGNLHLKRQGVDSRYTLTTLLNHFFPVTDATVSGPGMEPISAKTVMANKRYVSCLSFDRPHEAGEAANVKLAASEPQEAGDETPSASVVEAV